MLLYPERLHAAADLAAGFSTRRGGVSEPPFDTLNLGLSVGDDPDAVEQNRTRFFEALGFQSHQAAIAGQVHGSAVLAVTEGGLYRGYDGLVTAQPGVLLCITAADCAAVLLADPEARIVGACHAGWRGTVACIVARTVEVMAHLGARPQRMLAYVSPCISRAAFEVGPEVAARFDDAFVYPQAEGNPHVDLKAALQHQLQDAGLAEGHIEVAAGCTASDTAQFFSHRAENGRTGRMMGAIGYR